MEEKLCLTFAESHKQVILQIVLKVHTHVLTTIYVRLRRAAVTPSAVFDHDESFVAPLLHVFSKQTTNILSFSFSSRTLCRNRCNKQLEFALFRLIFRKSKSASFQATNDDATPSTNTQDIYDAIHNTIQAQTWPPTPTTSDNNNCDQPTSRHPQPTTTVHVKPTTHHYHQCHKHRLKQPPPHYYPTATTAPIAFATATPQQRLEQLLSHYHRTATTASITFAIANIPCHTRHPAFATSQCQ